MASILVVGQEQRSLERFHRVLSAEGWRVRVAQSRAQALQAAALEPPDLVLAGAAVPGAEEPAGGLRGDGGRPPAPRRRAGDRRREARARIADRAGGAWRRPPAPAVRRPRSGG